MTIQDTEQQEVLFRNSTSAIGRLNQSGTFCITRGYHEGMDDLHDTCSLNNGNDTEQEYLTNPATDSWGVAGDDNAVAYIDAEGNFRLRGIFITNWTHWDYWD